MLCFWTLLDASNNSRSPPRSQVSSTHHSANTFLMIDRASDSTKQVDQLYLISSRHTLIRLTTNYARASSPAICSCGTKGDKE